MKRYSLQDLMQMRMTGVEEFYLASDVDAANRILRDELNKDEHVMEADQARIAQLEALIERIDVEARQQSEFTMANIGRLIAKFRIHPALSNP